jgi:hypothetical protein
VAFFDEVFAHGKGSLLLIPGATLFGVDKLVDNVLEAKELFLFVHAVLLKSRRKAVKSKFGDIEIKGTCKSLDEIHERRQYLRLFDQCHGGEKTHGNVTDEAGKEQALGKAGKKTEEAVYTTGEGRFKQIMQDMRQKPHHENTRKEEQGHGKQGGEAGRNAVVGEHGSKARAEGAGKDYAARNAEEARHFLHKSAEEAFGGEKEQYDEQDYVEHVYLEHRAVSFNLRWKMRVIVEERGAVSRRSRTSAFALDMAESIGIIKNIRLFEAIGFISEEKE